jgi:sugar-specific transcriptional regulator TrmB
MYIESAVKAGLSGKASVVYVVLLQAGTPLSPKVIILKSSLHRQYVYDALHELEDKKLVVISGTRKTVKYCAVSPDKFIQEAEKKRLEALESVSVLMELYNKSPAGNVEIISGSQAVIESEFRFLHEAKNGDTLDIIGGAGMHFVSLFQDHIEEYEALRKQKNICIRYIGGHDDVAHNRTSVIKNESKRIMGIENIVNICVRPRSVTFNIYQPEIMSIHIRNESTVVSQKALFEALWKVAM